MKPLRVIAGSVVTITLLAASSHAERVGLTQTWVDNTRPPAYRIEGGSNEFHARGEICNLRQAFIARGDGFTVKFIPRTNRGGRYEYAGGSGTYAVLYDGRTPFSIVTPTETYRLKETPGACRG